MCILQKGCVAVAVACCRYFVLLIVVVAVYVYLFVFLVFFNNKTKKQTNKLLGRSKKA